VWTTRAVAAETAAATAGSDGRPVRRRLPVKRRYPTEALIFDTETEPGPAQRLRLLVWRVYRDAPGEPPGYYCVEEGIAYPDDLPERDLGGFRILSEYAPTLTAEVAPGFGESGAGGGLTVKPVSWWLEKRLLLHGYKHREYSSVVGFNLPFDLARLASYWAPGRGYYRGGWSLGLWGTFDPDGNWHDMRHRPRLLMKAIDPRRTLFGWGSLKKGDADAKGSTARFIDLRTLAFALTDRSYTLESACAAFGDPYEKSGVDYNLLTRELIDYALQDVRHTAQLYRNTLAELAQHEGIDLASHKLYSPATVGARYLATMGVERPLAKFTGLTNSQLGWGEPDHYPPPTNEKPGDGGIGENVLGFAMSAFYGGRAEARIVRTPVPVVHVDFTSMYPAVSALLGTWKLLRAAGARTVDATVEVRALLADPRLLDRCLTRELWAEVGVTLVQIEPDGDILPVRATYRPGTPDLGIGLNPLTYDGGLWYALPDVIAATLLGCDKPPTVTQAIRIVGEGIQDGLRPVALRGGPELDPTGERDPFLVMIEQRARVKNDGSLSAEERKRLELFLKITANATAYGSLARFDRRDLPEQAPVTVHGPDPDPREDHTSTPEDPGPFCFPPVACSITAGARLILATLERLICDAGGTYAFCDTDSMAIVAQRQGGRIPCKTGQGETIHALTWKTVRGVLDRFAQLNPYDPKLLEPWKVEHESLDRQLYCYAISAKRYLLYRARRDGTPDIVTVKDHDDQPADDTDGDVDPLTDWSEHGLGLYLDPTTSDPERPSRDDKQRRVWIRETWEWILAKALNAPREQPAWAGRYALTRFTISSPTLAGWFKGYNSSRPREEQVRPGSFGLIAHPAPAFPTDRKPTATYESRPERWTDVAWYDRSNGQPITVTTAQDRHEPERFTDALAKGSIVIDTLATVLGRYTRRPEHKSLTPDGQPATSHTHGLLLRRPINSNPSSTLLTGKEGNKIIERSTGQVSDIGDYRNDYSTRADRWGLVLPILRDIGARTIITITQDIPRSSVYNALRGARPRKHEDTYLEIACAHAATNLERWGLGVPAEPSKRLTVYLRERDQRGENLRRCEWCGGPLPANTRADARYCPGSSCRKAAERAAKRRAIIAKPTQATPQRPRRPTPADPEPGPRSGGHAGAGGATAPR